MRKQSGILFVLMFMALTGCTTPPDNDFTALRSGDSSDPKIHAAYIAQEEVKMTGIPFVEGNAITLLRDGNQTFPAMLAAIKTARHYIYMESFTFDAKAGKKFADALVKKRKAGVKIDLIYDSFGSSDTPTGVFDYLRRHGIKLVEYNPIETIDVVDGDANHRDHRKLLIIDGEQAFVGGVNISVVYLQKQNFHRYFDKDDTEAYKHIPWRDTHIKIEGPAVSQFQKIFEDTWKDQKGDPRFLTREHIHPHRHGNLSIEAIYGAPMDGRFDIYQSLMMLIALAQHDIKLSTGYFVPTPALKNALIAAAQRGVDVTLLLPSTSDSDLALAAGHSDYTDLLDAGVKIYELQGEVLHAKTAVIDGVWSTVGSSNLDWRSAAINNECNAVIMGNRFGSLMQAMFMDDLTKSQQITPEAWADRPIGERLHEFKASLIDYFL